MNGSKGYLVTSILFLMAGTLNLLNVNYDAIEWTAILPGILFLIVASVYFYNFLKYRNRGESN